MARDAMLKPIGDHLVLDVRHYLLLPPEYRPDTTARRALEQYLRSVEKATATSYFAKDDGSD